MKDQESGWTTETPSNMMDFYCVIIRYKISFCEHITLLPYIQVQLKVMTKISGRIHIESYNSLLGRGCVRSANGLQMLTNKLFENLLARFSDSGKQLSKPLFISYAENSPVIELAVTGTLAAVIFASFRLMDDKATTAHIWQHQTKVSKLSFAAPKETFTNFTPLIRAHFYGSSPRTSMPLL